MTETERKEIEEEIALREKRLALREKEHALEAKQGRLRWTRLALFMVFVFCSVVIGFGGWKIWELPNKRVASSEKESAVNKNDSGCGEWRAWKILEEIATSPNQQSKEEAGEGNSASQQITLPDGELVVIPTNKAQPVIVKAESKQSPAQWPLLLALALNGILVLAGLGIAASMVKALTKSNDDE